MPSLVVARLPSSRHPDVTYEVRLNAEGVYMCDCPGFSFRKRCKHVAAMTALRARPLAPGKVRDNREG